MAINRRKLLQAAGLSAVSAGWPQLALSQQFPTKSIRLIVAASAGATVDVNARYCAEQLTGRLKTGVIVDNRPGAGGGIGSDMVGKASPDGYTLLFTGITHFTTRLLPDAALTYDPINDFVAIAKVSSGPLALVVPTESPYKSIAELVQAMKAKPGDINYGSGGKGSTSHLAGVMFNDLTQTKARHIAYKGNTQALTDTVGGQIGYTWQGSAAVIPLIKAGRLRALAVSTTARWESLPEVPTAREAGVPGYEMASWMGCLGPKGVPQPVVQLWSDEFVRIARAPEYKEFCDKQGMTVDIMDTRSFQAESPREQEKWKRVIALAHAE